MAKQQYKNYDEEFKKTIVSLYESGKKISELSREYGVGHTNIRNWINKYQKITTSTGETTNNDEILKLLKWKGKCNFEMLNAIRYTKISKISN